MSRRCKRSGQGLVTEQALSRHDHRDHAAEEPETSGGTTARESAPAQQTSRRTASPSASTPLARHRTPVWAGTRQASSPPPPPQGGAVSWLLLPVPVVSRRRNKSCRPHHPRTVTTTTGHLSSRRQARRTWNQQAAGIADIPTRCLTRTTSLGRKTQALSSLASSARSRAARPETDGHHRQAGSARPCTTDGCSALGMS